MDNTPPKTEAPEPPGAVSPEAATQAAAPPDVATPDVATQDAAPQTSQQPPSDEGWEDATYPSAPPETRLWLREQRALVRAFLRSPYGRTEAAPRPGETTTSGDTNKSGGTTDPGDQDGPDRPA